jgi:hypothetical protein
MARIHLLALVASMGLVSAASATPITVGGYVFQAGEEAFADDVTLVEGSLTTHTEGQAREILTGSYVGDTIRVITPDVAVLEIIFTDNGILNGLGTDLVIFELSGALGAGTPDHTERFEVTVFDGSGFPAFVSFDPIDTGYPDPNGGLNIFAVEIDLSDFGLAPGAITHQIRIGLVDNLVHRSADPTALGALSSVSVPEARLTPLFGLGLLGIVLPRLVNARRWVFATSRAIGPSFVRPRERALRARSR